LVTKEEFEHLISEIEAFRDMMTEEIEKLRTELEKMRDDFDELKESLGESGKIIVKKRIS